SPVRSPWLKRAATGYRRCIKEVQLVVVGARSRPGEVPQAHLTETVFWGLLSAKDLWRWDERARGDRDSILALQAAIMAVRADHTTSGLLNDRVYSELDTQILTQH